MSEAPEPAKPSADDTLAGRRFHRHARNCPWCKPVLEAEGEAASPAKLCDNGHGLWRKAVAEYMAGGPPA